tara:strand:+ start:90 stop:404 length:315 start_codon:yes stop_codon:yes gene_type:complete
MPVYVLSEDERNKMVNDVDFRQTTYNDINIAASAIQEIISGSGITIPQEDLDELSSDTLKYGDDYKHDVVEHHVAYLETMVSQDFWTTEDMTAVNKAITDGKAY